MTALKERVLVMRAISWRALAKEAVSQTALKERAISWKALAKEALKEAVSQTALKERVLVMRAISWRALAKEAVSQTALKERVLGMQTETIVLDLEQREETRQRCEPEQDSNFHCYENS